ncbi:MAG: glycine--tRNA ligase subunit beta, partial [Proteobacteria bacterium]|nr:glycine--tRNA ligase subunit beta [Pseudomonadota bacterium]
HIEALTKQAASYIGGTAVIDDNLLNEVTGLVEWPTAITGSFDKQFLEVPSEALIASMQGHQKYFPVVNQAGELLPNFIAISNIASKQPEIVQAGNERVIRPRLTDAAFFWQQDKATPLVNRLEQLKNVIFQKKLGSLYDKSKRVAQLCGNITKQLGDEELQGIRAGQLAKCDLVTDMVGEFPELQGIMGQHYAKWDNETDRVATALQEQYMPRFAGDELPATTLGQALSIADKLDTLVGIFGIGQIPTGDKDPFGLRRAALSILRIIIECRLPLDLKQLLTETQAAYPDKVLAKDSKVFEFTMERLRHYYQEQNIPLDSIEAVLVCQPTAPLDFNKRIQGIKAFRELPEMASLASANKRIHNILKKAGQSFPPEPNPAYFKDKAERNLYDAMESVSKKIMPLLETGDYQAALQHLASLREVIDTFFDDVMVMVDDSKVRDNRLASLQKVRGLFLQVADISRLQV